jgi:hypothetical protein
VSFYIYFLVKCLFLQSIVKWLAYWAIGFNMAMVQQRNAINEMLNEMLSLVPLLLPENKHDARKYLESSWEKIVTVTASLESKWSSEFLEKMFKDYIQDEADRIRRNLEDVKYKIDEVDTLYLVTGPDCIEKVGLYLVCLAGNFYRGPLYRTSFFS